MDALLTAISSWPVATAFCICLALILFREPLKGLIVRIVDLKFPGFRLNAPTQAQTQAKEQLESKPTEEGLTLPPLPKPLDSNPTQEPSTVPAETISLESKLTTVASMVAALTNAERAIRAEQIKNFGLSPLVMANEMAIRRDLSNIPEPEQVNVLIRHLAVVQLSNKWERTCRIIFGSQIALLHHLNLYGRTPTATLTEFYTAVAKQHPEFYATRVPQESYFNFLESNGLIVPTPDAGYDITLAGKEFLQWMTAASISPVKPG